MAGLSLSQAAKATGRSKSTIGRAIQSGRLSALRNDSGTFTIEPSELFRAFPKDGTGTTQRSTLEAGGEPSEIHALRDELAKALQRAAVAEAIAEERIRALDAAERHLVDLRRLLPGPQEGINHEPRHSWWHRFSKRS